VAESLEMMHAATCVGCSKKSNNSKTQIKFNAILSTYLL
jgi:hypothetical protein